MVWGLLAVFLAGMVPTPDHPSPVSPVRSLAYLHGVDVGRVKWIRGKRAAALKGSGIRSVTDLLLYAPRRHIDRSRRLAINELTVGEEATVIGKVERVAVRRPRRRMAIVEATVTDGQGSIKAVWFNQAYQARRLERGIEVALSGRIDRYRGRLQINSPALDVLDSGPDNLAVGRVVPVYRTIGSIGTGVLRLAVHNALQRSRPILDPLPVAMIERHELVPREEAINSIHFPESLAEVGAARRRLVFDEFFRHEVALAMTRKHKETESVGIAHRIHPAPDLVERFIDGLPFLPTGAQRRVIDEIGVDMAALVPMHRLLHGEVGSGKTVVAVAALLVGVQSGYQAAIMAPTEVLAEQHYEGVTRLLSEARMAPRFAGPRSLFDPAQDDPDRPRIGVALLTGSRTDTNSRDRPGRARLLADIAGGEVDIVIGTHALIQEGVRFARLGAAVVDEQHRFGVHQRVKLKEKAEGADPDLLIMTATPIPRTLSMTLYGALDVSALDEMPAGRKRIRTWTVSAVGDELRVRRRDLLAAMEPRVRRHYGHIARGPGDAGLTYLSSWGDDSLAGALAAAPPTDLKRSTSTVGPHRDDVLLEVGGLPARSHASQGEQRSLALALRLAVDAEVRERRGVAPVLLLDDVFSELDAGRATALLETLPPGQRILTTAASQLPAGVQPQQLIRVADGTARSL